MPPKPTDTNRNGTPTTTQCRAYDQTAPPPPLTAHHPTLHSTAQAPNFAGHHRVHTAVTWYQKWDSNHHLLTQNTL